MEYTLEFVTTKFKEACTLGGVTLTTPIKINGRLTSTLGRVCYENGEATVIEFSKRLLETVSYKDIRDTIFHEAAHYIVSKRTGEVHGHDAVFKACCKEIGLSEDAACACAKKLNYVVPVEKRHKYTLCCENCGVIGGYDRKGKVLKNLDYYNCSKCHCNSLYAITNW